MARLEYFMASIILLIVAVLVILVHADPDHVMAEEYKAERIKVQVMPELKSGMPCDLYTQQSEEEQSTQGGENEQETDEETGSEQECETAGVLQEFDQAEPEQTDDCDVPDETEPPSVVDQQVGQDVLELLAAELNVFGVGWWFDYAVAQMMQESGGNPWAENSNGLDKGLFQYRITYWQEPESIFDVNAQIRRYVREVYSRINAGLSVEEIISRHYTSDYVTEIDWQYVNDVLKWMR